MLVTNVGGVITKKVGVDGRVVRSAKASVPFLARLTGQGVESGAISPSIVRFKVPESEPPQFVTVSVTVDVPALVGVPEIVPVLGSIDKPWGRKFALKIGVSALLFIPGVKENWVPVVPDLFH
jgi:hypothetical protein